MDEKPAGAGKSSFDLIDAAALFAELPLTATSTFLDVACGAGAYSLAAAERIGLQGKVFAFDLWTEGIEILNRKIEARQSMQIRTAVVDLTKEIPLESASVDVALLATVLHDFISIGSEQGVLQEIERVMSPSGTLAVVEFKVMDGPPGPPRGIRLPPETVCDLVTGYGFSFLKNKELGPYNYLSLFRRDA